MCLGRLASPPLPTSTFSTTTKPTNTQTSPTAENTGANRSASENVENKRKGRKDLKIPLLEGYGTGVQIPQ